MSVQDSIPLATMVGSETAPAGHAKLQIFHYDPATGDEQPLSLVAKHKKHGVETIGRPMKNPAAPGHMDELGHWYVGNYSLPEGTILKVFASRSTKATRNTRLQPRSGGSASLYVRLRGNGPHNRIELPLTGDPRMAYSAATVEGRFDVCDADLRQRLAIQIKPQFERFCDDSLANRIVRVVEIEGALVEMPSFERVTMQVGDEVVEVSRQRRRRTLDL